MDNSRVKTVYLNSTVTLICQFLQIILGFVIRKIFIDSLGLSYLGYNSVFSNILQMLNLADLGIGVAITSFLFKPIAEKDRSRVAALMNIYKKIYRIMGFAVLAIGLLISIPLEILVPDAMCSVGYLRVLFYITLAGTVSTYFLAYKRTLIVADQRSYIANFVDMGLYFVVSVIQIIILLVFPNYILFLVLQIAKNIVSNFILLVYCNRKYGKIEREADLVVISEYTPQIIQYVKDVFVSRLGATIFYGTDNVIISIFRGSLLAGYLSNYTMITGQLTTIVNQVLASLQATFGNYIYSGRSIEEQKLMSDNYFCVNYCIGNFCMVCFAALIQPFVGLFFGKTLLLPFSTVIWLGVNLMLTIMIQLPSQVFVIYKLFRYDRPIIAVSAILNIIISTLLVQKLGIDGVLIGTFVTSLIYLFSRFYIISKYVYKTAYYKYVGKIFYYFLISFTTVIVVVRLCEGYLINNIGNWIIEALVVSILALAIPALFLSFTKEFEFLIRKVIPQRFKCLMSRYFIICIILISIFIVTLLKE